MIESVLIIILSVVVVGTVAALLIRFFLHYMTHKIELNRLTLIILVCLGFGILYDCLRSIGFLVFGGFTEIIDLTACFMKIFLLLVGLSAVIRLLIIENKQSGNEIKHESYIRLYYYVATGILTVLAGLTLIEVPVSGLTFHVHQIPFFVSFLIILCYVPAIIVIGLHYTSQREITNQKLSRQSILLGVFMIIMASERILSFGNFFVPFYTITLIFQFSVLTAISFGTFYLFSKYPDFWDELTAYFNVEALYLIKTNGNLIFQYNLGGDKTRILSANNFLLGSLIHALTMGFKQTLIGVGKLDTIMIGEKKMVIEEGKHVIGMIFVTTDAKLMKTKLITFVQRFETRFESVFQNWDGSLSEFISEETSNLVNEIFR